jgi:hypothetical protein
MKRSLALIGILAALVLSACATRALAPTEAPAAPPAFFGSGQSLAGGGAAPLPQESLGNRSDKAVGQVPAVQAPAPTSSALDENNRLVIQNAELSIVVADVNAHVKSIETMAKAMGGFIVSVQVYQDTANDGSPVPQAQVVVRVPQDKIDEAITQIKQDTVDVQKETRSGQDVTDQYVDLQSRLTAKQAAQDQLLKIMQNANRTQDVLDVYAQLQQVQSDIEVLKGQIKYYEQSAAMSAISVNLIAEKMVKPIEIGGWKPQGVASEALQQLVFFWQDFADFLIRFFVLVVPVLLTIGIPLFLIYLFVRWLFRRTRKPKAALPAETPK